MNVFFLQYQYNISLIISNISKKYKIPKKNLLKEFYPNKIDERLKTILQKYDNKISQDTKSNIIQKIFLDKDNNKYVIVDSNTNIQYENIYTAIRI